MHSVSTHLALVATASLLLVVATVLHSATAHALVVETAQRLVTAEVVLLLVASLHSEVVHLLAIALVTKIVARVLHTIQIVLHTATNLASVVVTVLRSVIVETAQHSETALALETNHVSEISLASAANHHSMVSAKTSAQNADTSHQLELAPHRGTTLQIGTMITSPATTHTTHRLSFQTFFAS
jgi:hypothetical protein